MKSGSVQSIAGGQITAKPSALPYDDRSIKPGDSNISNPRDQGIMGELNERDIEALGLTGSIDQTQLEKLNSTLAEFLSQISPNGPGGASSNEATRVMGNIAKEIQFEKEKNSFKQVLDAAFAISPKLADIIRRSVLSIKPELKDVSVSVRNESVASNKPWVSRMEERLDGFCSKAKSFFNGHSTLIRLGLGFMGIVGGVAGFYALDMTLKTSISIIYFMCSPERLIQTIYQKVQNQALGAVGAATPTPVKPQPSATKETKDMGAKDMLFDDG